MKKLLITLLIFCSVLYSTIITVDDSGGKDYTNIQTAIDNASASDTIHVSNGTYNEYVALNSKNLVIESEFANTSDLADVIATVINSAGSGNNPPFSTYMTNDSTYFNGFTLTGSDSIDVVSGGGIFAQYTSCTIENCIIRDNEVRDEGGGIVLRSFTGVLRNCQIYNNKCNMDESDFISDGGGITVKQGCNGAIIENCLIYGNEVRGSQPGGGISIRNDKPKALP